MRRRAAMPSWFEQSSDQLPVIVADQTTMTLLASPANRRDVYLLMRWRVRVVAGALATDLGFLTTIIAAALYVLIVTALALQAWAGGLLLHDLYRSSEEITRRLLGLYFVFLACFQVVALHFFRVGLQCDLRTARWRTLPIAAPALRYARVIDSWVNPGAVAVLLATWILVFRGARPSTPTAVLACVLAAPAFVFVSQAALSMADELFARARTWVAWGLLFAFGCLGFAVAVYASALVVSAPSDLLLQLLEGQWLEWLLWLPPWTVPLRIMGYVAQGQAVAALLVATAAVSLGTLLLSVTTRCSRLQHE